MDLANLGWGPAFEESFGIHRTNGYVAGRVALEGKQAYVVVGEFGDRPCSISGKLSHGIAKRSQLPKVGDWVALQLEPGDNRGTIHAVLTRQTKMTRKVPGRRVEEQVLATNVDTAFVVLAMDQSFNLRRLERFLLMIHEGGIQPVVVLNKADLAKDAEEYTLAARQVVGTTPVLEASARTGRGMHELRKWLRPRQTAVFVGTSGVGKSSLINKLYGEEIQATLEVRETDAKGRHSTTWRELICLPNGSLVIDTPGMREFHMWIAEGGLDETFPDIVELGIQCKFTNCGHVTEKGCAVLAAVSEGRFPKERYDSYQKLRKELDYLAVENRKHTYYRRAEKRRLEEDQGRRNVRWEEEA